MSKLKCNDPSPTFLLDSLFPLLVIIIMIIIIIIIIIISILNLVLTCSLQAKIAQRKVEAAEKSVLTDGEAEAMRREQGKASQEVKEEWEKRQADIASREAKRVRLIVI
jgi:predicted Holliday junction resolvase-like endonuclease